MEQKRPLILIVDDVAMNRAMLSDVLSDKYNTLLNVYNFKNQA